MTTKPNPYDRRKNTMSKQDIVAMSKWANQPSKQQDGKIDRVRLWESLHNFVVKYQGRIVSPPGTFPARLQVLPDNKLPGRLSELGYTLVYNSARLIRAGRDAWLAISKAESFDQWKMIGSALAIGRGHALRVTGANSHWGAAYSKAFNIWVIEHGFNDLPKSTRTWALQLHENFGAIVAWRATLSDRERRKLRNPQSNVRGWRRSTGYIPHKCRDDLRVRATAHWWPFVRSMSALPPEQRLVLWNELFDLTTLTTWTQQ
jgi:hypothetical protein